MAAESGAPHRVVVVDASLAAAAIIPGPAARAARETLLRLAEEGALLAPAGLVDAEVLNALRKALLRGALRSLQLAVEAYLSMPIHHVAVTPLVLRLAAEASLAGSLSGQDSVYLALATTLNAALATLDTGLARAAARLLGPERVINPRAGERGGDG